MTPYVLLDKKIGQTPLEVAEQWRSTKLKMAGVSLAYAGRLDPMASGKLLILIGEECKKQAEYHNLDKEYQFDILFNAKSDSGDVLGIVETGLPTVIIENNVKEKLKKFVGEIEMPYPIFSAKTVQGKPLHTWAMEKRLDEIEIPTRKSTIYSLKLNETKNFTRDEVALMAVEKINLLPTVTDPRKSLGNDFRRPEVLASWKSFSKAGKSDDQYSIVSIKCICSSGTYMRTLAEFIAESLNTVGLAFNIHREKIGLYDQVNEDWSKIF